MFKQWPGLALCLALAMPSAAYAWGFEGHEIVATIARHYLTPAAQKRVDELLAADTDSLTTHDMAAEATWADRYRTGHPETASWHFVDIELDQPDLKAACFGFPASPGLASAGPKDDCVVDKIEEFRVELGSPATQAAERLLALKFLLHFVGDIHQPLHAADSQFGKRAPQVRPADFSRADALGVFPDMQEFRDEAARVRGQKVDTPPSAPAEPKAPELPEGPAVSQ